MRTDINFIAFGYRPCRTPIIVGGRTRHAVEYLIRKDERFPAMTRVTLFKTNKNVGSK
jgi:hypothetical protein